MKTMVMYMAMIVNTTNIPLSNDIIIMTEAQCLQTLCSHQQYIPETVARNILLVE